MQTYQKKPIKPSTAPNAVPATQPQSGPSMDALRAGTAQPTADMLGHKVDLPGPDAGQDGKCLWAQTCPVCSFMRARRSRTRARKLLPRATASLLRPASWILRPCRARPFWAMSSAMWSARRAGKSPAAAFLSDHALEARADREGFLAAQAKAYPPGRLRPCRAYRLPVQPGPCRPKSPKRTKALPRRRRLQPRRPLQHQRNPPLHSWPACRKRRHSERSAVTPSSKPCMMPMATQQLQRKWMKLINAIRQQARSRQRCSRLACRHLAFAATLLQ